MFNKSSHSFPALAILVIVLTGLLASCSPATATAIATEPAAATEPVVSVSTDEPVATQPVAATLDGATLMDERCSVCHSVNRITSEDMSLEEWTSTVDRMMNKGADLNEDERQVLIDFLTANY